MLQRILLFLSLFAYLHSYAQDFDRIVVIGDVHGSDDALLELLYASNCTISKNECIWREQEHSTLLVQMGDIVDRGPGSLAAWNCMRHLSATASKNAQIVRLLGSKETMLVFIH